MADGRWPPVYDAEDVKRAIATLATGAGADATRFYGTIDADAGVLCQGDIVRFHCGLPAIDEQGDVSVTEEVDLWFVLGNTCDYNRSIEEVPSFLASPMYALPQTTPQARLEHLRTYRLSREFYLPRWASAPPAPIGFFADLTKTATLSRLLLERNEPPHERRKRFTWRRPRARAHAVVVARLSQDAWFLLNAVFVRFLARDDGRYDPA